MQSVPALEFATHVEPRRIAQRDAAGHQPLSFATLKYPFEPRQFGTIVDAGDIVGARRLTAIDRLRRARRRDR